jgi:hypothetical protein
MFCFFSFPEMWNTRICGFMVTDLMDAVQWKTTGATLYRELSETFSDFVSQMTLKQYVFL